MIRFDDQVVLVTGAGRGLGEGYVRLFAATGASVVAHDAGVDTDGAGGDPAVASRVAESIVEDGGRAIGLCSNLLEPGACEQAVATTIDTFGRLDVLVHNAGVVIWEDLQHPTDSAWEQTMGVNAGAGFRLIRAALPHMRAKHYGRIVLTVSGRATHIESAAPGLVSYSAAKMAVYGLMIGFKANVLDDDIHINAISPVAATRVLVQHRPELTVASVAAGVAALASTEMTSSGNVLAAAGGRFRLDRWHEGRMIDLGPTATPQAVLDNWADLHGPNVDDG